MRRRFQGLEGFAIVLSIIALGGAVRVLYSITFAAKYLLFAPFLSLTIASEILNICVELLGLNQSP